MIKRGWELPRHPQYAGSQGYHLLMVNLLGKIDKMPIILL